MLKLCAERRWVMSGTPARLTSAHDALRSLQALRGQMEGMVSLSERRAAVLLGGGEAEPATEPTGAPSRGLGSAAAALGEARLERPGLDLGLCRAGQLGWAEHC